MLLFRPSLSSGTAVCVLTSVVIGSSTWAYVSTQELFYEYFFGAYGFKTYIWQQSAGLAAARDSLLATPVAYYILVGVAATAVGLAVYALLQGLSLLFAWRSWSGLDTLGSDHQTIVRELTRRLSLRIVTLLGWSVFGACFFSVILPFVTLLNQTGIQHIQGGMFLGWPMCAIAAIILALTLHLQVVFLRLVFLRPRLFWGADAAEEAEAFNHR